MKKKIQKIKDEKYKGSRVETGAVQVNDDWPGYFIRGDNCMYFTLILSNILSKYREMKGDKLDPNEFITISNLESIIKDMKENVIIY